MADGVLRTVPRLPRSRALPVPDMPAMPTAVLREGSTCWKYLPATRAALLIDGAAYFAALRRACENARHSILILGWDIRADLVLEPDASHEPLRVCSTGWCATAGSRRPHPDLGLAAALLPRPSAPALALHLGLRTHERVRFVLDAAIRLPAAITRSWW